MIRKSTSMIMLLALAGCAPSAAPIDAAEPRDAFDAGAPVDAAQPSPCDPVYAAAADAVGAGAVAFGPRYGEYPPSAPPPLLFYAPALRGCIAVAIDDDAAPGALRLRAFADEATDWTLELQAGARVQTFDMPDVVAVGVVSATVTIAPSETMFTLTARGPTCGLLSTASVVRHPTGEIEVVGYHDAYTCFSGGGARSRLAYKTDVHYVSDEERDGLRDDLMSLRLARYRYHEDPASTRRVGIILDDLPGESPVADPDGEHVDLYAYASLAIATVQQQQREIEELRARLDELERAAASPSCE